MKNRTLLALMTVFLACLLQGTAFGDVRDLLNNRILNGYQVIGTNHLRANSYGATGELIFLQSFAILWLSNW